MKLDVKSAGGAVSGGWWSGRIDTAGSCSGSDSYITVSNASLNQYILIDIWRALADSLWTSSVVINVYVTPSLPFGLKAGPETATDPATITKTGSGGSNYCTDTSAFAVLTVYNDGTFSLA
jgi:hypothetical protein